MFLDYLALGFLIFGALVTFYLIIGITIFPTRLPRSATIPIKTLSTWRDG